MISGVRGVGGGCRCCCFLAFLGCWCWIRLLLSLLSVWLSFRFEDLVCAILLSGASLPPLICKTPVVSEEVAPMVLRVLEAPIITGVWLFSFLSFKVKGFR